MKLFITNKKELDERFPDNGNNSHQTAKQIHQEAYRELYLSVSTNFMIPLCLTPEYKDGGFVLLDFVNKKGDIYFYEFTTTAS
jgi:ABC-type molybdate transport system substrate-binding protein